MWLAGQDILQTGIALKQKKWLGDHRCALCGVLENVDHIFFNCHMTRFTLFSLKEALGWDRTPTSMQEFLGFWLPLNSTHHKFKLFCFSIVFWVMMQVGWYWLTQKLTNATHLIIFEFWVRLTQYKSQTSGTSVPDNYTKRDSCCYFPMNAAAEHLR